MRPSLRRGLVLTVVGALAAGALVHAFMPGPVPVDIATITRGALKVTVDEEGRTRVKEVYIVSAPISGRVLRIERHVGDTVIAGETVLAAIRPTDPTFLDVRTKRQAEAAVSAAKAARSLAQAELTRARAELEFASTERARARRLAAGNHISQTALDRAELGYKTGHAAVAAAKAELRVKSFELETALASLIEPGGEAAADRGAVEVRAPVSGRVFKLLQESESVIQAGTALIEIGDPQDLEIVVELLSTDAVRVAKGAEVVIEEWGGGKSLRGRVLRVEPYGFTKVSALGIEEQRVNVVVDFTDPPALRSALGHGYRVETRIIVWQAADVIKAPVSALFRHRDGWAVFTETEGMARLRPVSLGHRNSREAEIVDGIKEGERVVLYPSDRVVDGVQVVQRPGR
jgi:HlyD family secretion protein